MTEAELTEKRKKLFEKYEADRKALWEKWEKRLLKSEGLDGPYYTEEKKLTKKFMEDLKSLDGLVTTSQ